VRSVFFYGPYVRSVFFCRDSAPLTLGTWRRHKAGARIPNLNLPSGRRPAFRVTVRSPKFVVAPGAAGRPHPGQVARARSNAISHQPSGQPSGRRPARVAVGHPI